VLVHPRHVNNNKLIRVPCGLLVMPLKCAPTTYIPLPPPRPKPTLNAPTKHKTRAMNEFFEHGQASENESETKGRSLCSA